MISPKFFLVIWFQILCHIILFLSSSAAIADEWAEGEAKCLSLYKPDMSYGRQITAYKPVTDDAIHVDSSAELKRALEAAYKARTIVVADGRYDIGETKTTGRVNLIGESLWGAVITGSSILTIRGRGSRVEGLRFSHGGRDSEVNSRDRSIAVMAHDVRVVDNYFVNVGLRSTVPDGGGMTIFIGHGSRTLIKNNVFKKNHGIAVKTTDRSRGVVITQNDFLDSPSYGSKSIGEIAQLGNAWSVGQAQSPHDDRLLSVIRRNYICGWTLENELISIKGDRNLVEANFIEKSSGSVFVVRMGNENIIRENVMFDVESSPVRISGERNIIEGNCFFGEGNVASLHTELEYPKKKRWLARAYWSANDNIFYNNVYVGDFRPPKLLDSRVMAEIWTVDRWVEYSVPRGNVFYKNVVLAADIMSSKFVEYPSGVTQFETQYGSSHWSKDGLRNLSTCFGHWLQRHSR